MKYPGKTMATSGNGNAACGLTFGLLFVLMPSGLLIRPIAWLLDWSSPPIWQTVQDPYGLTLMVVLIFKDMPFFIFMMLAAFTNSCY